MSADSDNGKPLRCPVVDCSETVDMILKSSDGKLIGAHCARLCQYSPFFPFPPVEDGVLVPPKEPLDLAETGAVLEILMHHFHPEHPLPKTESIPISDLEELAEAARKYDLHSAIEVCRLAMLFHIQDTPSIVVRYAVEHGHPSIANKAAYQCLVKGDTPWSASSPRVRAAWDKYYDQHKLIYRLIVDSNPVTNAHPGGSYKCKHWDQYVNRVKAAARRQLKRSFSESHDFETTMMIVSSETKGGLEHCRSCNYNSVNRWRNDVERKLPSKTDYWNLLG